VKDQVEIEMEMEMERVWEIRGEAAPAVEKH
jgi:hypothetical protein